MFQVGGRAGSLSQRLGQRQRYERQIDRLHERHLLTRQLYELRQDEVPLATLTSHRRKVARMLARSVAHGRYQSDPAVVRTIIADGKERVVFSYRITDVIVHGVVADLIDEALTPSLSPRLYSYRKGVSWSDAVSDLAAYLRNVRKQDRDPRSRHMYIARRDIEAYTDSIPVGRSSPLWPMLRHLLAAPTTCGADAAAWTLVDHVIAPRVLGADGSVSTLTRGVATGQPISCVLFNLYLSGLDRCLDAVPGAFYARYSDDLLFAHPDPEVVRAAMLEVDRTVEELGLRLKASKSVDYYLTTPGRPSDRWPTARPARSVPFLGMEVAADGTVSLGRRHARALLRDVDERVRSALASQPTNVEEAGSLACAVVNGMLDPDGRSLGEHAAAGTLLRVVTDRSQLAQLDYRMALGIAKAITHERSVRAFRTVSYQQLRQGWGLRSLEHERNRHGRRRAST